MNLPTTAHLGRQTPAGEVLRRHLAGQLQETLDADVRVRLDQPGSIHEMRISVRRLQAALEVFRPLLDDAAARDLAERLGQLALDLGVVRDGEVLLGRLSQTIADLPFDLIVGPVQSRLEDALLGESHRGLKALRATLESPGYALLMNDLAEFVASGIRNDDDIADELAGGPAGVVLAGLISARFRKLEKRVEKAYAAPDDDRAVAFHQVRKCARKLRYAAEASAPVFGPAAMAFGARMEEIQATLGEHQDSVAAAQALVRLTTADDPICRECAFSFGVLAGIERGRADEARLQFIPVWQHASNKRQRAWLRP